MRILGILVPIKLNAGMRLWSFVLPVAGLFLAGVSSASAEIFTYSDYQATYSPFSNVTITYSNPNPISELAGMGQITLLGTNGTGLGGVDDTGQNLTVFCMDIYHHLAGAGNGPALPNGTFAMDISVLTSSGSGSPNPTPLSTSQLSMIGKLVTDAFTIIHTHQASDVGAAPTAAELGRHSAALQLAIWEIEYGTSAGPGANKVSGPNNVSFAVANNSTGAALLAMANSFITSDAGDGSTPFQIELLQPVSGVNQDLVFIAVCNGPGNNGPGCSTVGQSPLPGAFPLLASGLGAFGLLGWRKKRKSAALAA